MSESMSSSTSTLRSLARVFSLSALLALFAVALSGCPGVEYPNCRNDQDCRQRREVCVNARCQQCRSTSDCPAEHTCLRNRCVPGLNACEGDNDCLQNQRCENHRCVPRTECDANRACPSGRACVSGRCVVEAEAPDPEDNRGRLCNFEPIYFGFDRDDLDQTARASLARGAQCLERERNSRYVLIGRTDPRGTAEYNLALGERRARTVQRYLTALGVAETRLAVSSEGMEAAAGTDEQTWARDRRVDFRPRD
ncbi:MAG: OmpA family protein [Polyangiales bacterium]